MKKRILVLLLSATLLVSLLPGAPAFAAAGPRQARSLAGENPFQDVSQNAYYYDAVLWAVNHDPQITAGTGVGSFSPNAACTRAQVVTFLWRAAGKPAPRKRDNPFTDVAQGAYYYDAVLWAVEQEITAGVSKDRFAPANTCTRAQIAAFLWRACGQPEPITLENPFLDVREAAFYEKAVAWAVEKNITAGVSRNRFAPANTCTRAQIVTFLWRAYALGGPPTKLEPAYLTTASIGSEGYRGFAVIDVSGSGTQGDVVLQQGAASPMDEAHTIAVVDASIADGGKLEGTAEIRIRYRNKNDTATHLNGSTLLAGWYNPDTKQWETVPYIVDEENQEVIILTDHLSLYGIFEVEGQGTRTAFAPPLSAARIAQMKQEAAKAILGPYEAAAPSPASEGIIAETLDTLDYYLNGRSESGVSIAGGQAINTIVSRGGQISTGWIGKMGTTCTVIGLVGASVSVANNMYRKGPTDPETITAIVNLGVAAAGNALSAPVQYSLLVYSGIQMACSIYDERDALAANDQFERLYGLWVKEQDWGSWNLETWKKNILDPMYEKYYTNGSKATPYENYQDYLKHVQTLIRAYPYRFSLDYRNGDLAKLLPNETIPKLGKNTENAANETCFNHEIYLGKFLSPYFEAQARQAYINAVNGLEDYCEQFRQQLNQEITVNFVEDIPAGGASIAKNCYVAGAVRENLRSATSHPLFHSWVKNWRADFDEAGTTYTTFTGTAYASLGAPERFYVYDKLTNLVVGSIPLGTLDYGENTVRFDPADLTNAFVTVREEPHGETYRYAGMRVRLAPYTGRGENPTWDLDDQGRGVVRLTLQKGLPAYYYDNYSDPARLEVVDDAGTVVKTVPFTLGMNEVVLNTTDLTVNVSCANDQAVNHYAGRLISLRSFTNNGGSLDLKESHISWDGTAVLTLSAEDYNFGKNANTVPLALYVWEDQGSFLAPTERHDLVFDENGICELLLSYEPPEETEELLDLSRYSVQVTVGQSCPIHVISGKASDVQSRDPSIATGSTSSISGHSVGSTTISYTDAADPAHIIQVAVTVVKPGTENWGFYKMVPICEEYVTYGIYGGSGEGRVTLMPPLGKNTIPYVNCSFSAWQSVITRRAIPSGSDVGTALIDGSKFSQWTLYYRNPNHTGGGSMQGYNPDTDQYSKDDWADIIAWDEEDPCPSVFAVTTREYIYASVGGKRTLVAVYTNVTRYELTAYRSWGAVAEELSASGWTTH